MGLSVSTLRCKYAAFESTRCTRVSKPFKEGAQTGAWGGCDALGSRWERVLHLTAEFRWSCAGGRCGRRMWRSEEGVDTCRRCLDSEWMQIAAMWRVEPREEERDSYTRTLRM